jgi:hypothetical protein
MKSLLIGAALATALTGLAGAASAAPTQANNCFLSSNWSGWHAPDDKTLYLRVNLHDIYRVDLNSPSAMLKWPSTHLVNVVRGSNYICSPLDLQLSIADNDGGGRDFLFIKAITKLTPDEVAVIPRKELP